MARRRHRAQVIYLYDFASREQIESVPLARRQKRVTTPAASKLGRQLWDGLRLKELRDSIPLSQQALAERSKVSKGEISRHERNAASSNPSVDALGRLALALGQPLHVLLQPSGSPIPKPDMIYFGGGHYEIIDYKIVSKSTLIDKQKSPKGDTLGALSGVVHSGTDVARPVPASSIDATGESGRSLSPASASEERVNSIATTLERTCASLLSLAQSLSAAIAALEAHRQNTGTTGEKS